MAWSLSLVWLSKKHPTQCRDTLSTINHCFQRTYEWQSECKRSNENNHFNHLELIIMEALQTELTGWLGYLDR